MKILSFGEILFDTYENGKCIGGAPFNFSAHIARNGMEAYLLSAIGNDVLGMEAIEKVKQYGVITDFIHVHSHYNTGECRVTLDNNGIPNYNLVTDVAYDHIPLPTGLQNYHFDAFYFGTLALRSVQNKETVQAILNFKNYNEVFVDMNIRKPFCSLESMQLALDNATILKVSDEELPTVMNEVFGLGNYSSDEMFSHISIRSPKIKLIIVTCGAEGSLAYDTINQKKYQCDAVHTDVVSTVGAGDSFSASFLAHYLKNYNIYECLAYASKVSAYVVSQKEAIPEMKGKCL